MGQSGSDVRSEFSDTLRILDSHIKISSSQLVMPFGLPYYSSSMRDIYGYVKFYCRCCIYA